MKIFTIDIKLLFLFVFLNYLFVELKIISLMQYDPEETNSLDIFQIECLQCKKKKKKI